MVKNKCNHGFWELFSFLSIIKRDLLLSKNKVDVDKILQKKGTKLWLISYNVPYAVFYDYYCTQNRDELHISSSWWPYLLVYFIRIPFLNTIFQVYHARLYIHKSVKRIIKDIINVHNSFNLYISDWLCLKKTSHYPDTAYAVYLTFNINWVLFNTLFSI